MKDNDSLEVTISLLVSYAYGMLAPGIAMQVKEALEQDELLRLQYQGIIQLIKEYPDQDPEELLEQMGANVQQKVDAALQHSQAATKPLYRRWWLMAAMIIVLAGVGTFIAVQSNHHSAKELAAAIIKDGSTNPYDNATRSSIVPSDSSVAWKEAFVQNNYDAVISYLQDRTPLSNEEQFFLALAYLKATPPQPVKAEPLLRQLVAANSDYTPDAWLYLGLTQTLEDKRKEAIESLNHVEQTDQVKDLLERLRQ
jgi:hypothetical protein